MVELVLGNRKELAPDEQQDVAFAEEVEELIDSNDPNWLQKVEEYMEGGYSLEDVPFDEMHEDIDKEQKARGQ